MLDLQLFASILGALYASVFGTVMCFHVLATMLWLGLKCSTRGFPSYRGLIWFCTGLGGAFLEIGGQYHVRPSPWYFWSYFNLRCMSHGFYEEIRVSEISMSVEGLRRCVQVHILFSRGSRFILLLTKFAKNMLDLQLFASILGALYASVFGTVMCFHFFATMLWLGLKCSTRGFPSYRGLIWFCTGLGGAFLEIGAQYHVRPSP